MGGAYWEMMARAQRVAGRGATEEYVKLEWGRHDADHVRFLMDGGSDQGPEAVSGKGKRPRAPLRAIGPPPDRLSYSQ